MLFQYYDFAKTNLSQNSDGFSCPISRNVTHQGLLLLYLEIIPYFSWMISNYYFEDPVRGGQLSPWSWMWMLQNFSVWIGVLGENPTSTGMWSLYIYTTAWVKFEKFLMPIQWGQERQEAPRREKYIGAVFVISLYCWVFRFFYSAAFSPWI